MGAKAAYVRGTCETLDKKERLSIMWFDRYIYETVNMLVNKEIVVGGEVFCGEKGIQITNPDIFEAYTKDSFRIYPIYSKIPQMSTEYFLKVLNAAIAKYNNVEYLPECITKHFNTVSVKDMIKGLHKPENEEEKEREWTMDDYRERQAIAKGLNENQKKIRKLINRGYKIELVEGSAACWFKKEGEANVSGNIDSVEAFFKKLHMDDIPDELFLN